MDDKLKQYGFLIDNRRCIGCHACTVACKSEHDVPVGVNRTWVKYIEKGEFPDVRRLFSVMRCNHCSDAPCMDICPTGALFRRDNGIVDFNTDDCIACKACTQACPYDAIYIDPNEITAQKCNFCAHKVEKNLLPACVIVCPTTAIVAGDLNDPNSKISQLIRENDVSVRKPEKGTKPNVFYIDGAPESLDPMLAANADGSLWSAQTGGVGYLQEEDYRPGATVTPGLSETGRDDKARKVYDSPDKSGLWGWKIVAYVLTKAAAAGISGMASFFALWFRDDFNQDWRTMQSWSYLIAMLFLGITMGLLVWDLGQPKRFYYLLLKGNRRSWLVRGAYVLTVFGATTGALMANAFNLLPLQDSLLYGIHFLNLFASGFAAIYTAFLLAQGKSREAWQDPSLIHHFALHGVILGALFFLCYTALPNLREAFQSLRPFLESALGLSVLASLFIMMAEHSKSFGPQGMSAKEKKQTLIELMPTRNAKLMYWFCIILGGHVLPLLIFLLFKSAIVLTGLLILGGLYLQVRGLIMEPQKVPL